MNSGNDLRSIRSWINGIYPDAVIHVQRNTARIGKPWFYLEMIDERMQDRGRGYHDMMRTASLHLITEGAAEGVGPAPEFFWRTREVLDHLCDRLNQDRVIPAYLFNLHYQAPMATFRSGGTYPIGAAQYAVSAVNSNGVESLPSMPINVVSTEAGKRLFLVIADWPRGASLAVEYRIYFRATQSEPWTNILLVERGSARRHGVTVINRTKTTEVEIPLTSLTQNVPNLEHDPPQGSRQRYGSLKVQEASLSMSESTMLDDAFHGFIKIKYASHSPHVFQPSPIILGSATSATITS